MIALALLALIPLLLTGPAAVAFSLALIKRGQRRALWILWAVLACVAILLGIAIAHTFADFFPGPGCFVTLLTPGGVILSALVWRLQSKRLSQAEGSDARPPRLLWIVLLVVIVLQLSAPPIGFIYAQSCALRNRRAARPLVAALESYRQEQGRYPFPANRHRSDLNILVPGYLEAIPPLTCQNPFARKDEDVDEGWRLYYCQNSPGKETLLLVPLIGTDSMQIYNPETKWWTRGNALDGYCP